jgi:hypothetical protein
MAPQLDPVTGKEVKTPEEIAAEAAALAAAGGEGGAGDDSGTEGGDGSGTGTGASDKAKDLPKDLPTALEKLEETQRLLRLANRESAERRIALKKANEQIASLGDKGGDDKKKVIELQTQLEAANAKLAEGDVKALYLKTLATHVKKPFVDATAQNAGFDFAKAKLMTLGKDADPQDVADVTNEMLKEYPFLLKPAQSVNTNSAAGGPLPKMTPAQAQEAIMEKKRSSGEYGSGI